MTPAASTANESYGARRITYCSRSYGYRRVCYDLPVPGYQFCYRRAVPVRRIFRESSFWESTRMFFPRVRGLVHTFNDIVLNADSWIVSYELELPRFLKKTREWHLRVAFDRLADERCRFILPMSDAARRWFLRRVPGELRPVIESKTRVFTGAVNGPEHFGLQSTARNRYDDQPLHLIFVGNDAFRKGGVFVLDAFDRLRRDGVNCTLTFIGCVEPSTYVFEVASDEYRELIHRLQNTAQVTWIPRAENRDVLAAMMDAHIGLLPTLDDSLGWSAIEMMAAGLPVIATNVVALPELVEDGITGRLIDIPCDEDNRWIGLTGAATHGDIRNQTHRLVVDGLVEGITTLYEKESLRAELGRSARRSYEHRYTPEIAAAQLKNYYDESYRGFHGRGSINGPHSVVPRAADPSAENALSISA